MRSLLETLRWQHSADELWAAYKASHDAVERRRLQVLALLREGRPKAEVQAITRYSDPTYAKVLHRYAQHGLEGLKDGRHQNPGAPTLLSDQELLLLAQTIRAAYAQGEVWNGARVQQWVKDELDKDVHLSRAYEFLDVVGFSLQAPRPQHAQADQAAQDEFKKTRSRPPSVQQERVAEMLGSGVKTNTDSV